MTSRMLSLSIINIAFVVSLVAQVALGTFWLLYIWLHAFVCLM